MVHIGSELSQIVMDLSYADLPKSVVHKVKLILLDSIGCALGAVVTDRGRIALELVNDFGGNSQATIIGSGRTSVPQAAFANAELIHALCYEACGPTGHIVPYVISPSLAIAEKIKSSGKELITALALALEVGEIAFKSMPMTIPKESPPYFEQNPRFSFGSAVVYGGVAGAGHLLKLDHKGMANAFGIGGTNMPVPATQSWMYIPSPSIMLEMNTLTGWVAQLATMSCLLAERGLTGDKTFLDGEWGFGKVMGTGDFKAKLDIRKLGKVWHIEKIWLKAYPCCGCHQPGIDLINRIILENNIKPSDIDKILVKGTPAFFNPLWNRPSSEMASFADCHEYNSYIFAVAAYHGQKPGPDWQIPATYKSPAIRELMQRVRVEVYPGAQNWVNRRLKANQFPDLSDTVVEITANGKTYALEGKSDVFPTMQQTTDTRKPLNDDEIKDKFRNNASYSSLKSDRVDSIISSIFNLEDFKDVSEMLKMIGL